MIYPVCPPPGSATLWRPYGRSLALLLVVTACHDVPLPSDPTADVLRRPGDARAISGLDWTKSTTGYDMVEIGQIDGRTTAL